MNMLGEGTHNKKRKQNTAKGEKPINKNVIVVDKNNNEIGLTYIRRAKGLVKKGRARFIDENKICIADIDFTPCPPSINIDINSEENIMDEKTIAVEELIQNAADKKEDIGSIEYYIIKKIDELSEYLMSLPKAVKYITSLDTSNPGCISQAEAIADTIKASTKTIEGLLEFYKELYEKIKSDNKTIALETLHNAVLKGVNDQIIDNIIAAITDILNSDK